jgi:hypothetical protein
MTTKESISKYMTDQAFDLKDRMKQKLMDKTGSELYRLFSLLISLFSARMGICAFGNYRDVDCFGLCICFNP